MRVPKPASGSGKRLRSMVGLGNFSLKGEEERKS